MEKYIALLRGINVSGQNKIKMVELKLLLETLDFKGVETYIQSGNIAFQSNINDTAKIEHKIEEAIAQKFSYTIKAIVLRKEEILYATENNPFLKNPIVDISKLCVVFLYKPYEGNVDELILPQKYLPEEYKATNRYLFLHCPNGFGRAKFNNNLIEKKLNTHATTRNWKTVLRLKEMITQA